MHGRPFIINRIICTINGKALISGSDWPHRHLSPPVWYNRGMWGIRSGSFWKTDYTIKNHLHKLCHDWRTCSDDEYRHWWHERISTEPDWSRLEHLMIEQTVVSQHSISEIDARDFMGLLEEYV